MSGLTVPCECPKLGGFKQIDAVTLLERAEVELPCENKSCNEGAADCPNCKATGKTDCRVCKGTARVLVEAGTEVIAYADPTGCCTIEVREPVVLLEDAELNEDLEAFVRVRHLDGREGSALLHQLELAEAACCPSCGAGGWFQCCRCDGRGEIRCTTCWGSGVSYGRCDGIPMGGECGGKWGGYDRIHSPSSARSALVKFVLGPNGSRHHQSCFDKAVCPDCKGTKMKLDMDRVEAFRRRAAAARRAS